MLRKKGLRGGPVPSPPFAGLGAPITVGQPGVQVDSWSLGVLLYILVYDHETLVKQISNGAYQQPPKPSSE
ncbi:hypothetical protein MJG53_010902 [Ovis ammon polii x Ovis aries]|uniref:Uncharacterized protein n=1 Tax=Ovis ammon polii x Ovis aries TaxID=2918886 RepID=A0ACB9URZ7_9CETA|nr:hypothetical protein MJG53_010902 [Ovis ammon polii x Ovis aries]